MNNNHFYIPTDEDWRKLDEIESGLAQDKAKLNELGKYFNRYSELIDELAPVIQNPIKRAWFCRWF